MSQLNIAVWGLGNHAKNRILPVLASMDEIKLLGVCSRNHSSVIESAEKWGCNGWLTPEEMLKCPDLDIVYIASPIGLHSRMTEKALNAGKHVWCEKPLTCDYVETQALLELAAEKGKVLTEAFMYLYHTQFKRVQKFVDESQGLNSIVCRFGIPELNAPSFRDKPQLCGGAFWDLGSYTTSAILALYPGQQVNVLFSEVIKNNKSSVDTQGRAILRLSSGMTAYLEWAVGVAYKNEIDLWTKDGSLFTNKIFSKSTGYKPNYYLRDLNGNMNIEHGEEIDQFKEMFNYFINIMDNKDKVKMEREIILQRAKLLNEIFTF
jgi:NDP-hexose-3-ketoreductase